MTFAEMLSASRLVRPSTSWEIARVTTEKPNPMMLKTTNSPTSRRRFCEGRSRHVSVRLPR
jgi:hypothetical protein